jgi:hypothetical protein
MPINPVNIKSKDDAIALVERILRPHPTLATHEDMIEMLAKNLMLTRTGETVLLFDIFTTPAREDKDIRFLNKRNGVFDLDKAGRYPQDLVCNRTAASILYNMVRPANKAMQPRNKIFFPVFDNIDGITQESDPDKTDNFPNKLIEQLNDVAMQEDSKSYEEQLLQLQTENNTKFETLKTQLRQQQFELEKNYPECLGVNVAKELKKLDKDIEKWTDRGTVVKAGTALVIGSALIAVCIIGSLLFPASTVFLVAALLGAAPVLGVLTMGSDAEPFSRKINPLEEKAERLNDYSIEQQRIVSCKRKIRNLGNFLEKIESKLSAVKNFIRAQVPKPKANVPSITKFSKWYDAPGEPMDVKAFADARERELNRAPALN